MHTITRIEGWETGTFITKTGEDTASGTPTVQTSTVRTGSYALRCLQNGVSAQAALLTLTFNAGNGRPDPDAFAAVAIRVYVRFASLPDSTRQILSLRGVGPTNRTVLSLTATGLLSLDGTLGTTPLLLNTWYQIRVLYDSATGLVSLMLAADGEVSTLEFASVTAASAGTVIQLFLGQAVAAATYDMFVDDIVIEAAASVASIDFPVSGRIYGLPLSGNGTIDPNVGTWGLVGAATRWEACTAPDDGDTTAIQVSGSGSRRQMFFQSLPGGVTEPINAAQFEHIVRQTSAQNWDHSILIHSADTGNPLVLTELTTGSAGDLLTSYSHFRSMQQLSPFTAVPWTMIELLAMIVGVRCNPSGPVGIVRVTTVMTHIDVEDVPTPEFPGGSEVGSEVIPIEVAREAYCVAVTYDPGGLNETDLSGRLMTARPLRQEKDVLLRQYKASDTELEFADTEGDFIELNPASFLLDNAGDQNWFGKPMQIQITLGDEAIVNYKGFVIGADAQRATGNLQLANRFQQIFDRLPFANEMGRVISTTGKPGIGRSLFGEAAAPADGAWLTRVVLNGQSPFDSDIAARVETLTVLFQSAGPSAQFTIVGSVTGFKGVGNTANNFTANDGSFFINPLFWENEGVVAEKDTCSLRLVWRPTAGLRIIDALIEFLTDPRTCALTTANLDMDNFNSFKNTIADQQVANVNPAPASTALSRLVVDEPVPLLTYLLEFAMHAGSAMIERSDGRFALNSFVPLRVNLDDLPVLCKSDDLMALGISHLQVYNAYNFIYNRSEFFDQYLSGGRWPPDFNTSFDKYQRLIAAPGPQQFRGYSTSARGWIEVIAESLYQRYRDPARIYQARAKLARMDADLDTIYRIDSAGPNVTGPLVEPFVIERDVTGTLSVGMDLIEIRALTDECGDYLQYDNPAMGYDDPCWSYF
jgi:hypothetical protein